MPDKYYLDIEGAKAIMQKSVDFFDKSKNYILVSTPTFNPSDADDVTFRSDIKNCKFMHKDREVGHLVANEYTIMDMKYFETFKAQNVTGDMFVRFVVDNYRNTGAKMDIVCNYIDTEDPSDWEWNNTNGGGYPERGSKAAIFKGCGPLGETYRFIYVSGVNRNVYGILCQVYWDDIDPVLMGSLTYSSDSYSIDRDFKLYNASSGSYGQSYYGTISPDTYNDNVLKSRLKLTVSNTVNTQLTGYNQPTSIELHYAYQSYDSISYVSSNIPTATGGRVYLTATINYNPNYTDVQMPGLDPYTGTLSIGNVQVSRSEPITEAELQAMFNPTTESE